MTMDDNDGQMIFGDLVGLKLPDILLTSEEKPQKTSSRKLVPTGNRTQIRTCYRLLHSGGQQKGWRMSCDVGEVTKVGEWAELIVFLVLIFCFLPFALWMKQAEARSREHLLIPTTKLLYQERSNRILGCNILNKFYIIHFVHFNFNKNQSSYKTITLVKKS